MRFLNREIENELKCRGAELIRFVDVSHLGEKQNRGLPNAVVFALPLTPPYIMEVFNTPDYVAARVADNYRFDDDEYSLTEFRAGEIADELAGLLTGKGWRAVSQSDDRLVADGKFDVGTHTSTLPNKTLAVMGGAGWIGKNNLFITPEYGAAQCLGTVLTDATLETVRHEPPVPKCGDCTVCADVCEKKVLKGKRWSPSADRDDMVDVYGCSTCLKCLIHCSFTHRYINRNIK